MGWEVSGYLPYKNALEGRAVANFCGRPFWGISMKIDGLLNIVTCLPKSQKIKVTHPALCWESSNFAILSYLVSSMLLQKGHLHDRKGKCNLQNPSKNRNSFTERVRGHFLTCLVNIQAFWQKNTSCIAVTCVGVSKLVIRNICQNIDCRT